MPSLDTLKPTLELGISLVTIALVVLVIASLWLVLRQLRQNTELAKAANAQSLVTHAGTLNFYQNQKGLLDPVVYDSWARDLRITVKGHDLSVVADNLKDFFPGKFGERFVALHREQAERAGRDQVPTISEQLMAVAPSPESNNAVLLEFGGERIYLPVVLHSALECDSQFNASDSM